MGSMKNSKDIEKLIKEVVQNLPEYSISLQCTEWKYEDCKFSFYDSDTDKDHLINLCMLVRGYGILKKLWNDKKAFFDGIKSEEDWKDAGNWDADIVDALIQCSIFSEIIYG